jgi:hypothetical protein
MMNRSVFMSLAAGLLASLAFASPSQAGTTSLAATFTVTGGTADDIELLYTAPVTAVSVSSTNLALAAPPFFSGSTVVFNFTPSSAGFVDFSVTSSGTLSAYFLTGLTPGVTASGINVTTSSVAVPEPASIALLGIGMTGFLAFRRLFKRTAVA